MLSSCTPREWNNPFDADCPKDYFAPTDFKVVQEGNNAKLTWTQDISNIGGFHMFRQVDSETPISIGNLDKKAGQYIDPGVVGGKKYSYSLSAYAGSNVSEVVTAQLTPLYTATLGSPVASAITSSSITVSSTITFNGGAAISSCGICMATTQNPTVNDFKILNGTANVNFTITITSLNPGTLYYIRTFAVNSEGTSYSDQISISTNAILSTISTQGIQVLSPTTASCGGYISTDGGSAVTARGVCWNTKGNPTVSDSKTTDGTGTGTFVSSITGLLPGTAYYVRAYSTNNMGTTYGDTFNFVTLTSTPVVTTNGLSNLTATTLTCGGTISSDGGAAITARGVCWSTSHTPTTANSKTSDGAASGSYSSSVTGLVPNVAYYIRAYASNNVGTSYGEELSFKTTATLPTVSFISVDMLSSTSVLCVSTVNDDGGSAIMARGVCWSRNTMPTIADAKSNEGSGTGTYNSTITGLTEGAHYFIRSYATNGIGTTYGNEIELVASNLPSVTSLKVTAVKTTTAQCSGNVTSTGGTAISARGLCWSNSMMPTLANSHTNEGAGTGAFTSNLSGLTPNTLYYVRTYATNQVGTSYGAQMTFVTSYGEVSDAEGNVYQTIKIGNNVWMRENLRTTKYNDGTPIAYATGSNWTNAGTGAYCWYNGDVNSYKNDYGALYNAYAITSNKLAPTGWHIPTLDEWIQLYNDGNSDNNTLKESGTDHWKAPNPAGNEKGFSAIPGGLCYSDNSFHNMGETAAWWCSTLAAEGLVAFNIANSSGFGFGGCNPTWGQSVRCILGTLTAPVVSTYSFTLSDVMATSATLIGTVADVGGPAINSRGFCWSTSDGPTLSNSNITSGSGYGTFQSRITGLKPGTTYYYRAYATNSVGTSYGLVNKFTTQSDIITFNPNKTYGVASDIDGNLYKTIRIGPLTWFAENLHTKRYNDGTPIQNIPDNLAWVNATSGAYCYYDNDDSPSNTFGALYNWYTVETGKLCPTGWRVPSKDEWSSLFSNVSNVTWQLMEAGHSHWISSAAAGDNQSGFTLLPGGYRWTDGQYINISYYGEFWSSTLYDNGDAYSYAQYYSKITFDLPAWPLICGMSIRCVKD
ncbi:MAG: hypothetical protein LWW85_06360 [Marinilabiliales bacterium]|nr:hypothetical protein [Marinilabiliales bacterium]